MSFRARAEANDTELLSTRQAERLSAIGGLAQPPLAAVLRAEARTHYLGAKSASLETPLRAFLDCAPLLLGFGRDPLRWALVR